MQRPAVYFEAVLRLHDGAGGWYLVSLPEDTAEEIDATVGQRAGFDARVRGLSD